MVDFVDYVMPRYKPGDILRSLHEEDLGQSGKTVRRRWVGRVEDIVRTPVKGTSCKRTRYLVRDLGTGQTQLFAPRQVERVELLDALAEISRDSSPEAGSADDRGR